MENYVLITGASSGIGRAIAVTLSKSYPLILGGRNVERLEETRTMCTNSEKHIFWNFDLDDVENIHDNLTTFIKDNNLKVGGFVHSAGIALLTTLIGADLQEIRKVMDINFFAAVEVLKVLVTKKINGKSLTNVILMSSLTAFRSGRGEAFYAVSKSALNTFVRVTADELAPNVRINTINPGITRTPMIDNLLKDKVHLENYQKKYLLGIVEVEDIANMAEFLMSEKSRRITGQHFVIDGGASIAL